ncbi:thioredoxin [Labilibaculum sp. A4]|uniref:thioredoxin family protein n=1 Tax=Labilibaculum euxinus TaxID=2686357 RepID=UPI000F618CDF|nr:thioredoxin family protein [Labilibaculum euxinus]MDQ1769587.1 thioredoxin family protein [Labilibaculum euxinus]MWN75112.1 thioredoxin [Labilibaculum euxinus]
MNLSLSELETLKEKRESFYIYFSAPSCGVCEVLSPKLRYMMKEQFPNLKAFHVDNSLQPEIAAQLGLYTNPSLLVYLDGKEVLRKSRSIGVSQVEEEIRRTYELLFN